MEDLLTISASDIARRIREKVNTPTEVIETHIRRIEKVNPKLNAVVTDMFQQARQEAKEATDYIAANGTDNLPPLFGVPVTIKDCWPIKDVRFVGGSWYMRDNIATEDAPVVAKLREAGAIILGKTNCPDMCMIYETENPVFGRTNNAWNIRRTAGGSSGGEGAVIGAGGSPLGIGSDVAGSVRVPATVNGIVSLKPTAGRIPAEGHVPLMPQSIYDWNTAGPMARRVEDLDLALRVLSRTPVSDYRHVDLIGRRVTVYVYNGLFPVQRPVIEAVLMSAGALQSAGMEVVRDDKLPMISTAASYISLFSKEAGHDIVTALGGGKPFKLWEGMRASFRGQEHISRKVIYFMALMRLSAAALKPLRYGNHKRLDRSREKFIKMMGTGGVLLLPTVPAVPPVHGWTWWIAASYPYTMMFNALGFPAVSVPVGFTKQNLPLGVQVVALPGEDETALAVAAELEKVFGGWKIPTIL